MAVNFKGIGLGIAAGVLALTAASAANATVFPVDSNNDGDSYDGPGDNFFITVGGPVTPGSSPTFVSAVFFNSYAAPGGAFDDTFTFTLPVNGLGGGSLSLSLADINNPTMSITDVIINGTSYASQLAANLAASAGTVLSVSNIPITAKVVNSIQVIGSGYGSYTGNISFQAVASAVPEPAAWAMMICGFGLVGLSMRQRRTNACTA